MITIEINGIKYDGFESISVTKNIETISGSFSFAATSNDVSVFPIKRSDPCKVFINNESVINGYVDTVNVSYDANSHSISISGRDRTEDIIDSTVIGEKEFNAPTSLIDIITTTLKGNGLSAISVINEAGAIESFPEGTTYSSKIGETVFEFIERYARKRQVLLTTNGNGDLVLARSGSTSAITSLQGKISGQFNNIKTGNVSYTSEGLFNKYTIRSQENFGAAAFGADITLSEGVNKKGVATDSNIRTSRQIEIASNSSDNNVDCANLAQWNANLRKARSSTVSVVVQGYYQDEAQTRLWKPNELVKVDDDYLDVNATLLVQSVEYNLSNTTGSTTTINLVPRNAYTLEAKINAVEASANEQGDNLIFS